MLGDGDDDGQGFQWFLGFVAIFGLAAVAVAFAGLFIVLTGGTGSGDAASLPEGFSCETFNGDPDVGHEAAYGTDLNTSVGTFASIDGGTTENGFELRFNVSDPSVLNTSARQADGTPVPVEVRNTTVVVASNDTAPFRLWVDSARGGTITRSELDICPPAPDRE
jgi:hypothetical protein